GCAWAGGSGGLYGSGGGNGLVGGSRVHGLCRGGFFPRDRWGCPRRHFRAHPGASTDRDFDPRQSLRGREGHAVAMGRACARAGRSLACGARPQHRASGFRLGWVASFLSLIGITLGTLYQKRYCGDINWRTGNLIQYTGAGVLFTLGAFAFETREIHWSGELIFAMAWLVLVLSIAAVGLMYWLIRRSAATGFASLFYLVPVVTAL